MCFKDVRTLYKNKRRNSCEVIYKCNSSEENNNLFWHEKSKGEIVCIDMHSSDEIFDAFLMYHIATRYTYNNDDIYLQIVLYYSNNQNVISYITKNKYVKYIRNKTRDDIYKVKILALEDFTTEEIHYWISNI
ncbi:HT motif family protein [Pigeonpox virus]|uniref:HT motif family protein n=1 Tax=Pigeonpox virus TaxID=10264 RepID=A0A068EGB2_9POXV|nr:HT motif family protein [Pigeonpox virus]AID46660.1 HT motif family protein [Pigeonpox virus]